MAVSAAPTAFRHAPPARRDQVTTLNPPIIEQVHMRRQYSLVFAVLAASTAAAQVPDDAELIQSMTRETTLLLVKIDTGKVEPAQLRNLLSLGGGLQATLLGQMAEDASSGFASLRQAVGDRAVYASVDIPISLADWPILLATTAADSQAKLESWLSSYGQADAWELDEHDDVIRATPRFGGTLAQTLAAPLASRPETLAALAAVRDYPIQLVVAPPDYVRRTIQELMPQLPPELGGGASKTLTDGIRWVAMGVNPAGPHVELVIQSASGKDAEDLVQRLPEIVASLLSQSRKVIPNADESQIKALLQLIQPQVQVQSDRVVQTWRGDQQPGSLSLVASALQALDESMRRQANLARFKQIILAMHNFHDVYGAFPPLDKQRDANGKSKLSWRVYLLPYLNQVALYNKFHLDEPWDSPHNRTLLVEMPDVFRASRPPTDQPPIKPGYTTILGPAGEGGAFGRDKQVSFADFSDGTSNTAVLLEVKPELAAPWTAPQDYVFTKEDPSSGLHVNSQGEFLAGRGDGSVEMLPLPKDQKQVLNFLQMNDGNIVQLRER